MSATAARLPVAFAKLRPWLAALGWGLVLGGVAAALLQSGTGARVAAELGTLRAALDRSVGPVWMAMALVGARVGWLGARALRSRFGRAPSGPVRPELGQLAPLFAALGLCGTVWGLSGAFDALGAGGFLEQLPSLLGGLGAAMTSTLAGLSLQIATLLLAAYSPAWSRLDVTAAGDGVHYVLDGEVLGSHLPDVFAVLDTHGPEALRVVFDGRMQADEVAELWQRLGRGVDAALPMLRERG